MDSDFINSKHKLLTKEDKIQDQDLVHNLYAMCRTFESSFSYKQDLWAFFIWAITLKESSMKYFQPSELEIPFYLTCSLFVNCFLDAYKVIYKLIIMLNYTTVIVSFNTRHQTTENFYLSSRGFHHPISNKTITVSHQNRNLQDNGSIDQS